jgi:hypothetical protein
LLDLARKAGWPSCKTRLSGHFALKIEWLAVV